MEEGEDDDDEDDFRQQMLGKLLFSHAFDFYLHANKHAAMLTIFLSTTNTLEKENEMVSPRRFHDCELDVKFDICKFSREQGSQMKHSSMCQRWRVSVVQTIEILGCSINGGFLFSVGWFFSRSGFLRPKGSIFLEFMQPLKVDFSFFFANDKSVLFDYEKKKELFSLVGEVQLKSSQLISKSSIFLELKHKNEIVRVLIKVENGVIQNHEDKPPDEFILEGGALFFYFKVRFEGVNLFARSMLLVSVSSACDLLFSLVTSTSRCSDMEVDEGGKRRSFFWVSHLYDGVLETARGKEHADVRMHGLLVHAYMFDGPMVHSAKHGVCAPDVLLMHRTSSGLPPRVPEKAMEKSFCPFSGINPCFCFPTDNNVPLFSRQAQLVILGSSAPDFKEKGILSPLTDVSHGYTMVNVVLKQRKVLLWTCYFMARWSMASLTDSSVQVEKLIIGVHDMVHVLHARTGLSLSMCCIFENALKRALCPLPLIVHLSLDNDLHKECPPDIISARLTRRVKGDHMCCSSPDFKEKGYLYVSLVCRDCSFMGMVIHGPLVRAFFPYVFRGFHQTSSKQTDTLGPLVHAFLPTGSPQRPTVLAMLALQIPCLSRSSWILQGHTVHASSRACFFNFNGRMSFIFYGNIGTVKEQRNLTFVGSAKKLFFVDSFRTKVLGLGIEILFWIRLPLRFLFISAFTFYVQAPMYRFLF